MPANSRVDLAALGELFLQMDRPKDALVYLRKAEALSLKTSYEAARVNTLLSLAGTSRQMGHLDQSVRYAREALASARAAANGAQQARALIELAAARLGTGAMLAAEAGFREALGVAEKSGTPRRKLSPPIVVWLRFSSKTGRLPVAAEQLEKAVDRLEVIRGSAPGPELRSSFLSQNWRSYEDLVYVLVALHQDRKAFGYSERGRARSFLDVLAGRVGGSPTRQAQPVDLNTIEESLRATKETLLDYMLGERESYLWVISGQGTRMVRLPRADPDCEHGRGFSHLDRLAGPSPPVLSIRVSPALCTRRSAPRLRIS